MITSSSSQPSRLGDSLVLSNTGVGLVRNGLPVEITQQSEDVCAHEVAIEEQKRAKQICDADRERFRQFYDDELRRKRSKQFLSGERLQGGPNKTFQAGEGGVDAGSQALQRHEAALQVQKAQQRSLTEGCITAFDGVLPSFLDEEYQYMKQASSTFPEEITSYNQMGCMRDYQRAISDASRRLPCGLCGGLFQEDEMMSVGLRDDNLQYFLQRTRTAPDCCAIKDDIVSLCATCSLAIAKRAIPPLSAGNFVNCLFCQDYSDVLKNLNTVEEAFIARAHVVGIFLKLTSGAKSGISYRGSCGHSVAVRQDPSELLKILPAARLRDHTTITVSWDCRALPSEENLARFCSVDKAKVVGALLWLCANNPVYKSVVVNYSVLDSWPDYHIPQEIRDAFFTLGFEPGSMDTPVEDEWEGYVTSLQDGLFENELDAEVEDTEPGSILSRSFFSNLHGSREDDAVDIQDDEEGTLKDKSRLPHILYKTTQHLLLMSAFTDPDYFTAAFPTLFLFGIGRHLGDASGDCPEEVSLKAFARYTMLHHSLLNHVQVKNGYWAKATQQLTKLSADDLQRAAQEFTDRKKISNPAIHSLITNMRIISSFNPESFGEKMRFRNLIFGKIACLGLPLIWFTLNPKDIGNIFVVRLAGEEVLLDEPGIKLKLLQLTIKNPSLVAQFFHVVITSFFACFFKTLSREPGIFGTVSSHSRIVELTTRMMLHLHGFAWLTSNIGAANFYQRLKSDADFKDRVLTYIRSIVRETVDLTLGQQFQSETSGSSRFPVLEDMTAVEFQEALDVDLNNVATWVQMHTHSKTCTKYQKKFPQTRASANPVPIVQSEGMATDADESLQRSDTQRQLPSQFCRFLFPRPLVPESMVTEEGYIRMERNHQFVNKYNPVIASATGYNHDVNFTASSPKALATIYYMTNYATKAQVDRGQLVLAVAVLKKAQEAAEATASENGGLLAPEPLDMSKFALKAYNCFTRDVEVGAPAVAHFLLGQPSAYIPKGDKSVTINFYWVKTNIRKVLNSLLDENSNGDVAESANHSLKSLKTPSLCGSFTSMSEKDTDILNTTLKTQDEIDEVLLSLFYLWSGLQVFWSGHLESLCAAPYKNTWLWNFVLSFLPPYLVQLLENVVLLWRSKEAADQDRKERGLEFDDYLEAVDHDVYTKDKEVNVDMDFAMLRLTESNLLQAALAVPDKEWSDPDNANANANVSSQFNTGFNTGRPEAALVPVLGYSTDSIASLQYLQASFRAELSVENLLALITTQYPLNQKQRMIVRALNLWILLPIRISSVRDQFLLYLGGIGGVGKTHLIKAFMFGLSIIQKHDDVLLTASTSAAAVNINSATYHSALSFGNNGNQPIHQATRLRLSYKNIFILNEISMVSLENLVQINERCNAIWDLNQASNTVFGGLPIVIFLGDFNQFRPVCGHAIWSQAINDTVDLQLGKSIWSHFTHVVFLTEQMRQAEDPVFQDLLQRAQSATLTEDDVATLNSCTTE
ncbi:hypothetical protein V502_03896, partial [Pseudogymnoascus sp. VKM F-4520 (FW-2644)]